MMPLYIGGICAFFMCTYMLSIACFVYVAVAVKPLPMKLVGIIPALIAWWSFSTAETIWNLWG